MPLWDFTDFALVAEAAPCATCRKDTCWVEPNFQTHLHPGPCDVLMWQEYFKACKVTSEPGDLQNPLL